jgi:hypothetical protein
MIPTQGRFVRSRLRQAHKNPPSGRAPGSLLNATFSVVLVTETVQSIFSIVRKRQNAIAAVEPETTLGGEHSPFTLVTHNLTVSNISPRPV